MFPHVDVCLFYENESPSARSIRYFSGIHTDMGMLLKFKRRQILYLSSLEEMPKVDYVVKRFNIKQMLSDLKRAKVKTIGLHYGELTKKTFDSLKMLYRPPIQFAGATHCGQ